MRSACPRIAETVVRTLSRPWLARSRAESAKSLARCVRFSRVSSPLIGAKRIPKPIPIPNPAKKDFMLLKLLVNLAARIEVPPANRDADSPRRLPHFRFEVCKLQIWCSVQLWNPTLLSFGCAELLCPQKQKDGTRRTRIYKFKVPLLNFF